MAYRMSTPGAVSSKNICSTRWHSLLPILLFVLALAGPSAADDQARQNALELMATFADFNPGMCKKEPSYTTEMVTQCLSLMTDVGLDDDNAEEWNSQEDMDSNRVPFFRLLSPI